MKRTQLKRGTSELRRAPMAPGRKRMKSRSNPEEGSIKALEQQLDDLTRRVMRSHELVCFTDGRPGIPDDPLELSHLFGRAQRPTRFDVHPDGGNHMQHRSCNQRHNDDKSIYQNEYIKRHGMDSYQELDRRAHGSQVFTWLELHRMVSQRESMLK